MRYLSRGLPCAGTGYAPVDVWADTSTGPHLLAANRGRLARYLSPQRADVLNVAITAVRTGRRHQRPPMPQSNRETPYLSAHANTLPTIAAAIAVRIITPPAPISWGVFVALPKTMAATPIATATPNSAFFMGVAFDYLVNVQGEYHNGR